MILRAETLFRSLNILISSIIYQKIRLYHYYVLFVAQITPNQRAEQSKEKYSRLTDSEQIFIVKVVKLKNRGKLELSKTLKISYSTIRKVVR